MTTGVNPAQSAEIIRLYGTGLSIKATARAVGIEHHKIRKILHSAGVAIRNTSTHKFALPRRDFDLERATRMRLDGKSTREIAVAMGFGTTLVGERLRQAGVVAGPAQRKSRGTPSGARLYVWPRPESLSRMLQNA